MRVTVAVLRRIIFLVAIVWLASHPITTASFADEAAPVSAEASGGSDASAASGNSDNGNTAAAVSVNNDSSASVDTGSGNAAANDNTSGAAATSQSSGNVAPPSPPHPAPIEEEAVTGGSATTPQTDSPPSGEGQGSAAGASTEATASAYNNGDIPVAEASASAQAGGIAVNVEASSVPSIAADTAPVNTTPAVSASLAVAGTESKADAHAEGGDSPTAYTSAGTDLYALAVGGANRSAIAEAGKDAVKQTLVNDNENWAIAYIAGGQFSIAVATNNSATAYSATYGAGGAAFTADDVWAAALSWASAYATANKLTAMAWAKAGALGAAGTADGFSVAASASNAKASIRIELVSHPSDSSVSGSTASVECVMQFTDWELLKKVKPEHRYHYISCICPAGWQNPAGEKKYACVRDFITAKAE